MLDYFSVIHIQIIIAPRENVGEVLHELDAILFYLWTECFL
jgi:hypothetical protein